MSYIHNQYVAFPIIVINWRYMILYSLVVLLVSSGVAIPFISAILFENLNIGISGILFFFAWIIYHIVSGVRKYYEVGRISFFYDSIEIIEQDNDPVTIEIDELSSVGLKKFLSFKRPINMSFGQIKNECKYLSICDKNANIYNHNIYTENGYKLNIFYRLTDYYEQNGVKYLFVSKIKE